MRFLPVATFGLTLATSIAWAQPTPPASAPAAAPAAAPTAPPAPRYNPYRENVKGQEALNRRDYKTAIKIFTETLDSGKLADNWIAPTLHLRGRAFRLSRQPEKAIADYQAAVSKDPKLDSSWYELALIYRNRDSFDKAIDAYSKAIDIKPDNHFYWYGRCEARLFINKLKEAETDCQKALGLKSDYVPALSSLGRVYEDQKQKQKALETYRKVLALDPNNKDAKDGIDFLTKGN